MINLITGLIAAIAHVLSGPDHLAAVTPLAIESKNKSWRIGMAWGIGHTIGILIIGMLFLLFRDIIPVEMISEYSEQIVGVMLILIGVWAVMKAGFKIRSKKHAHPHIHKAENGEYVHIHKHDHSTEHVHSKPEAHRHIHTRQHRQNMQASLGIGIFHGLAGVSHLFAILPTLALPSRLDAGYYVTGFGLGTLAAMIIFSALLGYISLKVSASRRAAAFKSLRVAGGVAAIGIGIWWIISSM